MKRASKLHAVPETAPACYPYENPAPCACCQHGHAFAASELRVRRQSDGEVLKTMIAAPGGYKKDESNGDRY